VKKEIETWGLTSSLESKLRANSQDKEMNLFFETLSLSRGQPLSLEFLAESQQPI
jgi:hypothetical protein